MRVVAGVLEQFQDIRHEASDFPCRVAKLPKNKNRNRYRDVSPFDHSRIKLHQEENDYINASLIKMEEAQRSYILTQLKCAQYWPQKEEKEMIFEDTNLKLTLISEDIKSYYTVRQLELENLTFSADCFPVHMTPVVEFLTEVRSRT
ncbi:tyrosine-protein phosphatase non-receptor type 1-like isoform X2 [Leptonychotes weddellii]|uniref:protein-tyrosine-phosphatase n=1 Tax=Leptonychotes weddellii TaxID=9713 RepID=A0A7F8QCJ1_LEPWE|nr:tyrosine-protein phosphatase non-receptor type 1-like isoform X2 [Leptonychotes weddellii]